MKNLKIIPIGIGIASTFFICLFIVKRIVENKKFTEKFFYKKKKMIIRLMNMSLLNYQKN